MKLLTAITIFSSLPNRATSEGEGCGVHDNSMDIPNADGAFHYTIADGVIQVCLEANNHDGFLAVGFSTDGKMISTTDGVNHTTAIGGLPLPDMPTVVKLDLQQKAGYQPFSALQTLTDVSYEVDVDKAILKFTKPLVEDGEVPISENGENTFLYSWGDVGGYHTTYGHLKTSDFVTNDEVEPATNDEVEPATNDEVEPATNDEVEPATNDEVEPATNDEVEPATNDEVDTLPDDSAAGNNAVAGTLAMVFGAAALLL